MSCIADARRRSIVASPKGSKAKRQRIESHKQSAKMQQTPLADNAIVVEGEKSEQAILGTGHVLSQQDQLISADFKLRVSDNGSGLKTEAQQDKSEAKNNDANSKVETGPVQLESHSASEEQYPRLPMPPIDQLRVLGFLLEEFTRKREQMGGGSYQEDFKLADRNSLESSLHTEMAYGYRAVQKEILDKSIHVRFLLFDDLDSYLLCISSYLPLQVLPTLLIQ